MSSLTVTHPGPEPTAMSGVPDLNLRMSTDEREDAIAAFGEHFAFGRLQLDEYEQRVSAALVATTQGDVHTLFSDLPAPHPAFLRTRAEAAPAASTLDGPVQPAGSVESVESVDGRRKSRVAAGLLQIMFPFGTGRFYTGHTRTALTQLALVFVGVGVIWSLVDGVHFLVAGGVDSDVRPICRLHG